MSLQLATVVWLGVFSVVNSSQVLEDSVSALESRTTSGSCGPSAGNAVCASGLCCGPNGVCGIGTYYCNAPSCLFQYGPACDANQAPSGLNTSSVPRPKIGDVPYGVSIRACNVPGKVALTFDDGPYIYTSDLLDILKARGVKATFFLVGNNGGKGQINDPRTGYPSLIRRMYNEGHQIGSHTWSHQDLSTLTQRQRYDQIIKNEIALSDILGFFPTYLRPPYMSCTTDCLTDLRDLGYHVANYDIDTLDWQEKYPNSQNIFKSALQSGNPKTNSLIPLAHDIHSHTVHDFVPFMIDYLKERGYTTALYGECLNDPPSNWYRYPSGSPSTTKTTTFISGSSSRSHSTRQTATPTVVEGGERAFGSRTGNGTMTSKGIEGTAVAMASNPTKSEGSKRYGMTALGLWAILGVRFLWIMGSYP
ncbi:hypothetical protein IFM61606_05802 [Aspergillus udagawae]|uniref:Chitin deacetylase n=1 Tax=Aspergillus udagawae TaxID=91492 RepID=A0ABQ1ATY4_9EURO|nr:hypothetical protein IFM51744_10191 [Aspergillus udagawae]GFF87981.1 hypothetical protein IFM53868_05333 [Aspergillus udagawae]GFG25844.1 hypothetical protein IFM61606_05802 [Aspergillus udagawae]